jgi:hypothetical protein
MADEPDSDDGGDAAVQIMTTLHFTLQTARSATVSEANGRASLFLTSVSMSLVALSFLAQATEMGSGFYVFAFVFLGCLTMIGVITFVRVVQTRVEDGLLARGVARIRHFYLERSPGLERYFVQPAHDDDFSAMGNAGEVAPFQVLFTTASLVGVVTATLLAVLAGLAIHRVFAERGTLALSIGLAVFALGSAAQVAYQRRAWRRLEERIGVAFPAVSERGPGQR